jgi:hypothetical protein
LSEQEIAEIAENRVRESHQKAQEGTKTVRPVNHLVLHSTFHTPDCAMEWFRALRFFGATFVATFIDSRL